jgi:hypothetical protein
VAGTCRQRSSLAAEAFGVASAPKERFFSYMDELGADYHLRCIPRRTLAEPHSNPADELARVQATIARLLSEQDLAVAEDRPAMAHACELLITIQMEKIRQIHVRGSAPTT